MPILDEFSIINPKTLQAFDSSGNLVFEIDKLQPIEVKDESFERTMENIKYLASCIYDLADEYLKTKDGSKSSPVVNSNNPFYNLNPDLEFQPVHLETNMEQLKKMDNPFYNLNPAEIPTGPSPGYVSIIETLKTMI